MIRTTKKKGELIRDNEVRIYLKYEKDMKFPVTNSFSLDYMVFVHFQVTYS